MVEVNGKVYSKLNLGSGGSAHTKFPLPWLNVDIQPGTADYVRDIRKLPSNWDSSFDEVRASHVLEHLYLQDWQETLREWVRVLEPKGTIRIIVPDLNIIIKCLSNGQDKKGRPAISGLEPTPVMAQIYGIGFESPNTDERWQHRMVVDAPSLTQFLESHRSLRDVKVYSQDEDPASLLGIKDDSQNQFSLCVQAQKTD